jgi:glycosyltransferase involved in cell wall biosynthesis
MIRVVRVQSRVCVGGPALHTILLAEGLSARAGSRYETTLFSGELEPGEVSMEDYARARGVKVDLVPGMGRAVRPRADLGAVAHLTRALTALRPTIVHTHTAKAGAVGRVAARLAGAPIVLHTFHGHVFEGYFDARKARAFVEVERALARGTQLILAISASQRRELVDVYGVAPADKVRVIPLGVDLDRFVAPAAGDTRDAVRAELGLPADAPVVFTAGRLVPIKRYDLLLAAFARVVAAEPRAHLVIAGDGELRAALEAEARAISPNVHFVGLRRDLERLLAAVDLFALTSDNEGTPVAAIEALTAGVAVVATDVGGVADVVDARLGRVVPKGDVGAIAAAILAQLGAPRLDAGVRREVHGRFSHRRLVRDMTTLYDELLERYAPAVARAGRASGWAARARSRALDVLEAGLVRGRAGGARAEIQETMA